ncbi:unnamed protein product [Caenorhabditis sp. 36 PRJEB53466]|nr:unnamed protein product [Caenorhabditis sp. 36 PRJEB53466]
MSYDEDWFAPDEFNKPESSPGGAGNFNIDNIPFNEDAPSPGQNVDYMVAAPDEYNQFNEPLLLSPGNSGHNGQHAGPGGQFQSMHLMQNNDTFDQHMQPSTSLEYDSFEMPTVISSNFEPDPFQDLSRIDDPNSYYANQQPSTSMGNDMVMGGDGGYDMMGPPANSSYMPHMDQMEPTGSVSSQPGTSQQDMGQVQSKPKPKKSRPNNKKKAGGQSADSVGTVLTKVNKMASQALGNSNSGNNGTAQKVEMRMSAEDSNRMQQLLPELGRLTAMQQQGVDVADQLAQVQAEIAALFGKNVQASGSEESNTILSQIQNLSQSMSQPAPAPPPPQPKKPAPKRNRNSQNSKPTQQQQQQPIQQQQPVPLAQMTPAKIVMEPPTTTMVPSNSSANNSYSGNENYGMYQPMDQQGTSQQYADYQQPSSHDSMHHQTKLVPSMNQRTHNYRQSVVLNSQSQNGPDPSPQHYQPQSHESHHMDQMHDQQYHHQNQQEPQQIYVPQQHQQDDRHMYQSHHDMEPTLGDVVRHPQGRYQGPQDAPNLRQQLLSNVNATSSVKQVLQATTTPSPGNLHVNNNMQQYGEQMHNSYPQSQEQHVQPHSQQGFDNDFAGLGAFFEMPMQNEQQQEMDPQMEMQMHPQQDEQFQPEEMYHPMEDQQMMDEDVEYVQMPESPVEMAEEELEDHMEERRELRSQRVKHLMLDQLNTLSQPTDVSRFSGLLDIFSRMLPYHHYTSTEEPVPDFDENFKRGMAKMTVQSEAIGNRIRNILLRDSMRRKTEWEENMLLFLETEKERRQLEEDRKAAQQDPISFLQNSDIIHLWQNNRLNLERTRQAIPPMPAHLQELDIKNGQLSAIYKEYEFDSYDVNRPTVSPSAYEAFGYEEESDSEPEPEPEMEEPEMLVRSDLSPIAGFPQLSPLPSESPARSRNESESTLDFPIEDESPILSPETEKLSKADQFRREMFGDDEELDKPEMFPFEEIKEAARKHQQAPSQHQQAPSQHQQAAQSVESSSESSYSADSSPRPRSVSPQPGPSSRILPPVASKPSTSAAPAHRRYQRDSSGSPELGNDYARRAKSAKSTKPTKSAEVEPIPLPVPLSQIKKEKDDDGLRLKLKVPIAVFQKGLEIAASGDEDIQEIPVESPMRQPIKLKFNLANIKLEEPSPDRELVPSGPSRSRTATPAMPAEPTISAKVMPKRAATPVKEHVFKTPLQTPLKSANSRKRRSDKIVDHPQQKKATPLTMKTVTPRKNGTIELKRFLSCERSGRKLTMKIGKIPGDIRQFVTPRKDRKGNLHKDLRPTKETRLKMTLKKSTKGDWLVNFTEKAPEALEEAAHVLNMTAPTTSSIPLTPPSVAPPMSRTAPGSRKSSMDMSGKDRKNSGAKNKSAFTLLFNPRATAAPRPAPSNAPSSSSAVTTPFAAPSSFYRSFPSSTSSISAPRPSTSSLASSSSSSSFMSRVPALAPVSLSTPVAVRPSAAHAAPAPILPIRTNPIVPKITVTTATAETTNGPIDQKKKKLSALLPWMSDGDESPQPRSAMPSTSSSVFPSTSSLYPSTSTPLLSKVKTEPQDASEIPAHSGDSPRASSSLSMSFFDDDRANGFPFLHSPKKTSEPLPVVEFSDDEETELAHSTFSNATDHLLGTSNRSAPVNGAPPILPWADP